MSWASWQTGTSQATSRTMNAEKNIFFKESTDENSLSSEQLQKILMDDNTEKTVTSGTPLKLEEGYELAIKSIDIDGNKVYSSSPRMAL